MGYADFDNAIVVNDTIQSIPPHTDNTIVADQTTNTIGVFSQYEITLNRLQLSAGLRFDNYNVKDKENSQSDKSGNVLSPRVTVKYDVKKNIFKPELAIRKVIVRHKYLMKICILKLLAHVKLFIRTVLV